MMGRMMDEYFLPLLGNFGFLDFLKHDPDVPDSDVTAEYCATHNWLVGSPDTVTRQLESLARRLPAQWIFAWTYNGLIPHAKLMHSIETWKRKVMPRVVDPA